MGLERSNQERVQNERTKRKKGIITGKGSPNEFLKGPGEKMMDVFVYKVSKEFDIPSFYQFLASSGFPKTKLEKVSGEKSQFNSFKLSVPAKRFDELFNPNLWPVGIKVRRYYKHQTSK